MSKEIEDNKKDAVSKKLEFEELENVVGGVNELEDNKEKKSIEPSPLGQFEPFAST